MLRLSALLLALGCLPSCSISQAASVTSPIKAGASAPSYGIVKTPTKGAVGGHPAFGDPMPLPGMNTSLIPFVHHELKWWFKDSDHFDEGGLAAAGDRSLQKMTTSTQPLRWHNAVAHDVESGEQWTLLAKRGVISRYWAKIEQGEGATSPSVRGLLFAVTADDTNDDGKLDDRDASRLLLTDNDGRNPRYVTPPDTQLSDVLFDHPFETGQNTALVLLREDRDGDAKYEEWEAPVHYLLSLDGEGPATRLVRPETQAALDGLLDA